MNSDSRVLQAPTKGSSGATSAFIISESVVTPANHGTAGTSSENLRVLSHAATTVACTPNSNNRPNVLPTYQNVAIPTATATAAKITQPTGSSSQASATDVKRPMRTLRPIDLSKLQQSGLDRKIAEILSKQKQNTLTKRLLTNESKHLSHAPQKLYKVLKPIPTLATVNVSACLTAPQGSMSVAGPSHMSSFKTVSKPTPAPIFSPSSSSSSSSCSAPSSPVIASTSLPHKNIIPPRITVTAPESSSEYETSLMRDLTPDQRLNHVKILLHKKILNKKEQDTNKTAKEERRFFAHLKPPSSSSSSPSPSKAMPKSTQIKVEKLLTPPQPDEVGQSQHKIPNKQTPLYRKSNEKLFFIKQETPTLQQPSGKVQQTFQKSPQMSAVSPCANVRNISYVDRYTSNTPPMNIKSSPQFKEREQLTPVNKLPTKPKTPQKSPQDIARKLDFQAQGYSRNLHSPKNVVASTTNLIKYTKATAQLANNKAVTLVPVVSKDVANSHIIMAAKQRFVVPDVSPLKTPFPTADVPHETPLPTIDTFKKPYPMPEANFYTQMPHVQSHLMYMANIAGTNYHLPQHAVLQMPPTIMGERRNYAMPADGSAIAPNSLIVLENKVLSQDEMIDLTALRLSKFETSQGFARPHKPIVEIKEEQPDEAASSPTLFTTNKETPEETTTLANVKRDNAPTPPAEELKQNSDKPEILPSIQNPQRRIILSSKHSKKFVIDTQRLKLPPEKIADLAKQIAERTAKEGRPDMHTTPVMLSRSNASDHLALQQRCSNNTATTSVRGMEIQKSFSTPSTDNHNANIAKQLIVPQKHVSPRKMEVNPQNLLLVKEQLPVFTKSILNYPKHITVAEIAAPIKSPTLEGLNETTEAFNTVPSPIYKSNTRMHRQPAVEILDEPNTEDSFSAVDFLASFACSSNPISEHTQLDLTPDEINLNASCSMRFSPLRDASYSPRKRKISLGLAKNHQLTTPPPPAVANDTRIFYLPEENNVKITGRESNINKTSPQNLTKQRVTDSPTMKGPSFSTALVHDLLQSRNELSPMASIPPKASIQPLNIANASFKSLDSSDVETIIISSSTGQEFRLNVLNKTAATSPKKQQNTSKEMDSKLLNTAKPTILNADAMKKRIAYDQLLQRISLESGLKTIKSPSDLQKKETTSSETIAKDRTLEQSFNLTPKKRTASETIPKANIVMTSKKRTASETVPKENIVITPKKRTASETVPKENIVITPKKRTSSETIPKANIGKELQSTCRKKRTLSESVAKILDGKDIQITTRKQMTSLETLRKSLTLSDILPNDSKVEERPILTDEKDMQTVSTKQITSIDTLKKAATTLHQVNQIPADVLSIGSKPVEPCDFTHEKDMHSISRQQNSPLDTLRKNLTNSSQVNQTPSDALSVANKPKEAPSFSDGRDMQKASKNQTSSIGILNNTLTTLSPEKQLTTAILPTDTKQTETSQIISQAIQNSEEIKEDKMPAETSAESIIGKSVEILPIMSNIKHSVATNEAEETPKSLEKLETSDDNLLKKSPEHKKEVELPIIQVASFTETPSTKPEISPNNLDDIGKGLETSKENIPVELSHSINEKSEMQCSVDSAKTMEEPKFSENNAPQPTTSIVHAEKVSEVTSSLKSILKSSPSVESHGQDAKQLDSEIVNIAEDSMSAKQLELNTSGPPATKRISRLKKGKINLVQRNKPSNAVAKKSDNLKPEESEKKHQDSENKPNLVGGSDKPVTRIEEPAIVEDSNKTVTLVEEVLKRTSIAADVSSVSSKSSAVSSESESKIVLENNQFRENEKQSVEPLIISESLENVNKPSEKELETHKEIIPAAEQNNVIMSTSPEKSNTEVNLVIKEFSLDTDDSKTTKLEATETTNSQDQSINENFDNLSLPSCSMNDRNTPEQQIEADNQAEITQENVDNSTLSTSTRSNVLNVIPDPPNDSTEDDINATQEAIIVTMACAIPATDNTLLDQEQAGLVSLPSERRESIEIVKDKDKGQQMSDNKEKLDKTADEITQTEQKIENVDSPSLKADESQRDFNEENCEVTADLGETASEENVSESNTKLTEPSNDETSEYAKTHKSLQSTKKYDDSEHELATSANNIISISLVDIVKNPSPTVSLTTPQIPFKKKNSTSPNEAPESKGILNLIKHLKGSKTETLLDTTDHNKINEENRMDCHEQDKLCSPEEETGANKAENSPKPIENDTTPDTVEQGNTNARDNEALVEKETDNTKLEKQDKFNSMSTTAKTKTPSDIQDHATQASDVDNSATSPQHEIGTSEEAENTSTNKLESINHKETIISPLVVTTNVEAKDTAFDSPKNAQENFDCTRHDVEISSNKSLNELNIQEELDQSIQQPTADNMSPTNSNTETKQMTSGTPNVSPPANCSENIAIKNDEIANKCKTKSLTATPIETTKHSSDIFDSIQPRKKFRKTLEDIKRSHHPTDTDSSDRESLNEGCDATDDFLGFDDNSLNSSNSKCHNADAHGSDSENDLPSFTQTKGGTLKNWLTTGKAISPTLAKDRGLKRIRQSEDKKLAVTRDKIPLKKRWDSVTKVPHDETDITDDTSPAYDEEEASDDVMPVKKSGGEQTTVIDSNKINTIKINYFKDDQTSIAETIAPLPKEPNANENNINSSTPLASVRHSKRTRRLILDDSEEEAIKNDQTDTSALFKDVNDATKEDAIAESHSFKGGKKSKATTVLKGDEIDKSIATETIETEMKSKTDSTVSVKSSSARAKKSKANELNKLNLKEKCKEEIEAKTELKVVEKSSSIKGKRSKAKIAQEKDELNKTNPKERSEKEIVPKADISAPKAKRSRAGSNKSNLKEKCEEDVVPKTRETDSDNLKPDASKKGKNTKSQSKAKGSATVTKSKLDFKIEETPESQSKAKGSATVTKSKFDLKIEETAERTNLDISTEDSTANKSLNRKSQAKGVKRKSQFEKTPQDSKESPITNIPHKTKKSKTSIEEEEQNTTTLTPNQSNSEENNKTAASSAKRKGRPNQILPSEGTFNPRLLLITKREQLDTDDPIIESTSGTGNVQCGLCMKKTIKSKWRQHLAEHYGIGWKQGEEKVNVNNRSTVLNCIINFLKDPTITNLNCRMCAKTYRSGLGMLTHIETCGAEPQRRMCPHCERDYSVLSLTSHIRSCYTKQNTFTPPAMEKKDIPTEVVFSTTGRAKRVSTLKAESRLKEIGEDLVNSSEKVNFNPKLHVKHRAAPLEEDVLRSMWLKEINNTGTAVCPAKKCEFSSTEVIALLKHIKNCKLSKETGFYCAFCKHRRFDTEPEAIKHIVEFHTPGKDFSDDSDCNIATEDEESSSNDDESDVSDDFALEEEEEQKGKSARKSKAKKKKTTKNADKSLNQSTSSIQLRKKIFDKRDINIARTVQKRWNNFIATNFTVSTHYESSKSLYLNLNAEHFTKYLPPQEISMKFSFRKEPTMPKEIGLPEDDIEWTQIERFKSLHFQNETFLFTGAPVTCCAWLPLPAEVSDQYLLVAYRKDMFKFVKYSNPKPVRTTLLLFKVTTSEKCKKTSEIRLHYGITIDEGPVYNFDFLPSGGYNLNDNRLGLVAVATVLPSIKVYTLPIELKPKQDVASNIPLIQLSPSFELCLNMHTDEGSTKQHALSSTQCLHVLWSQFSGHHHIFAGFSNGYIGIWDVNDDMQDNLNRFQIGESINFMPLNYFSVGEKGIRSFGVHYDTSGPRWIAATSFYRRLVVLDIGNMMEPIPLREEYSRNIIRCLDWCPIWEPFLAGYCDSIPNNGRCVQCINPSCVMYAQQKVDNYVSAVTSVHYTPRLNMCVSSVDNGDIVFMNTRELHYEYVLDKKFGERRIVSLMDVKKLDGKPISWLKGQPVKNRRSFVIQLPNVEQKIEDDWTLYDGDYKQKYGLIFQPLFKLKESHKTNYLSEKRRVPLNMVSFMRANVVKCNMNANSKRLMAVGYENGFIRLIFFDKDNEFTKS